jgi:hypothetical protein
MKPQKTPLVRRFFTSTCVEHVSSFGGNPVSKIQHAWGQAGTMGNPGQDMGMNLKKIPWSSPTAGATYAAPYLGF